MAFVEAVERAVASGEAVRQIDRPFSRKTIELLPALPDAWKTGSFHGLRAKGGLEVSAAWEDKKITWVQVKADTQAKINIVGLTSRPVKLRSGRTWEYRR